MSQNTFAASIATSRFDLEYIGSPNGSYTWANGLLYDQSTSVQYARRYQFTTSNLTPTGNYASIHFETNIVANASNQSYLNFVNRDYLSVLACSSSAAGSLQIEGSSVSTAVTSWTDNQNRPSKTLTVYGDIALGGLSVNQQQQIVCAVGSSSYAFFSTNYSSATANMYFEQNPMTILYTNNQSESLLQSQIYQNEILINQNNQMIQDSQEYYDKQYDAIDNIGDQSTSDIEGATNQQTTNLIGILTNFVQTITNIQPSEYCSIWLNFPSFAGGRQYAYLCQGRQIQIVNIFSSVVLVTFFIPLAYTLLKMIYNEIRSWTNG